MCNRKFEGGLGIRKLTLFNQALLAKHCWNMIISPNTLVARLFKALYYPNGPFLEAEGKGHCSPYWKVSYLGKKLNQTRS